MKETRSNRYQKFTTETVPVIKETKEEEKNEEPKKHSFLKKALITIFILIATFFIYGIYIEPKIFIIHEHKIETTLPENYNGLKIVQISDIHYGTSINQKELNKIINKINELKPDIIFFTGDLIDKNITLSDKEKQKLIDCLNNLKDIKYQYAIYGDEDNETYKEIINKTSFKLLDNQIEYLYYKDSTPLKIVGLTNSDNNEELLKNDENYYTIALIHQPDEITKITQYNPNIVMSGHSLGGLIKLPKIKPFFLPSGAKEYYNGYYKVNDTKLYVSNGLGTSNIPLRFNNYPSFNFYRLYA